MLKIIKSNLLIKVIFKNIHNKIKLKIIKYNKYMIRRLYIKTEDFKIYEKIKEFNEKLKLYIVDIDIKELDLKYKIIGKKKLELLKNVNFKELEKLNLSSNNIISDIKVLENVNFKELKELDLSENQISDIKVLENVNFKELKKLYLKQNQISDIKVFENVNFKELKVLDLSWNKISDIKVLENVNFKELKILYLDGNPINYDSTFVENLKSKINIKY